MNAQCSFENPVGAEGEGSLLPKFNTRPDLSLYLQYDTIINLPNLSYYPPDVIE